MSADSRFDSKWEADPDSGCHLWKTATNAAGYGWFWDGSRDCLAHRFSLTRAVGPAPEGKPLAIHSCRNRHCVNPEHLRWGSRSDNEQDKARDGTRHSTAGQDHPQAKLTERDVYVIRELADMGKPQEDIGALFGVSADTISSIKLRKTWSHLADRIERGEG